MPILRVESMSRAVSALMEEAGRYRLPAFQRDFVWNDRQVKELLESIRRKYPIGVLILWRPASNSELPFSVPLLDAPTDASPGPLYYVLDGQQRITALLLLRHGWRILRNGREIGIKPVLYHPTRDELRVGGRIGVDLSKVVRAKADPFGPEAKELQQYDEPWKKRLNELLDRIFNYTIPVHIIETTGEDDETIHELAEAFIRLNKQGVRIRNIELLLSLMAGTQDPGLRRAVEDGHRTLEGSGVDLQTFLRLFIHGLGLHQNVLSKPDAFRQAVRAAGRSADYTEAAQRAAESLSKAFDLLDRELGIRDTRLLPSQSALIPVAAYLSDKPLETIPSEDRRAIAAWFLLASLKGRYTASPNTKLDQDLRGLRGASRFPLRQILESWRGPDRYIDRDDFLERARRVRATRGADKAYRLLLYALLVRNGATDWAGRHLRWGGDLEWHHIFPRQVLENVRPELVDSIGNLTLIAESVNREIQEAPDQYIGRRVSFEEAARHFLPTDRPELLRPEQFEAFLEERLRRIYEFLRQQFPDIVMGLEPPTRRRRLYLSFPGDTETEYPIRHAYEILTRTAEELIRRGYLRPDDVPVQAGPTRYLVNREPVHPDGRRFHGGRRLSNGLYIDTKYDRKMSLRQADRLLRHFVPDATVRVEWGDES